jgi:hypothetical protein
VTIEEFLQEIRQNEKNRNLYDVSSQARGKSMKDLSTVIKQEQLEEIEEKHILKRWQSPSIIEALQLPTASRWIIFCTAVFFKYRAVNKRL